MSIRRLVPLVVALLLILPGTPARPDEDPILVTLARIKAAYREKKYPQAEESLRQLAELIAAPEREAVRPKVLPALHFYTAAVAFGERDEERAKASLRRFFEIQPNAGVDPAAYPKAFCVFFDAQLSEFQKSAPPSLPGPDAIEGGILPPYATRDADESAIPANSGSAEWAEGPVKFLMTDEEKRAFGALADDDGRRSFVNAFWQKRDPDPQTTENELEIEFYRRVQYADAVFSTEAVRGSLSDRGMVFAILGPPSYVGRSTIRQGQDPMAILRARQNAPPSPGTTAGDMEVWYYRRDRVMKGLPFSELQYRFVTRQGYGTAILEKDPVPLTALKKAARLLGRDG